MRSGRILELKRVGIAQLRGVEVPRHEQKLELRARMSKHHQLKNEARRAEQRSDWARAIELYKSAMRLQEEHGAGSDVGIYNRVGDLYLRQGDSASAVEFYEQAADRYALNGLHTSAIALCNKILRIAPDRDEVYGRLARLHASTGLLAEARSAFLRFAESMRERDRLSEALEAVQDLVSLTGDEELRTAFAEQLAGAGLGAQAVAQLRLVYQARVAGGRNAQDIRERILALDPDADPVVATAEPPPRAISTPEPPEPPQPPVVEFSSLDVGQDVADIEPVADEPSDFQAEVGSDMESVLTRFRSQVREIVEETDHAVHYDLGVAYMGMGLLEEAIGEFQLAMQSPALMESAHALLGECLRDRGKSPVPETGPPSTEGDGLEKGSAIDDFMMGRSLDLGVPAKPGPTSESEPPRVDPASLLAELEPGPAPDPGMSTGPVDSEQVGADESGTPDVGSGSQVTAPDLSSADSPRRDAGRNEEEDLADMLFQARLAQHRVRTASDEGRADPAAHLELGHTYERMGLLSEAVRDLLVAVQGPAAVEAEALDALERIAMVESVEAATLRDVLTSLMDRGRSGAAVQAGREFVERPGISEVDRQAVLALLPPEERSAAPAEPTHAMHPAKEALADLGDIFAELDVVAGDELAAAPVTAAGTEGLLPEAPGEDPVALFGEAEGLRAAGRTDEAASHYYRALELFEKKRDVLNAIRSVDRLLGLRPDDVVLHHQKTEFAIMTNDRDLLISAYLDLAACLRRQNGYRSARTMYGRILDLDSQNAEARAGIAAVDADELARERQRQESRGRPVARSPEESATPGTKPVVVQQPDEFDEMFGDMREGEGSAEKAAPDYESHYELGIAFRQMEMWNEAAREFNLAVQGMAEPLPAYERLGECLLALRRYDEARRVLGTAAVQPGEEKAKVGVLFHLGVAHLRAGDPGAARECLERVVRIDPSRADAAQLLSTLSA